MISTGRFGHSFPFFDTHEAMIAAGVNFIVLNVIAAMSVSALVKGLVTTHEKEKRLSGSLEQEKQRLLTVTERLEIEVEERKKAEAALQLSLEKYETIFRSAPVWVVLSSLEDGRYIEVNEAFLQVMGYERDEVIGKTSLALRTWLDPEDRTQIVTQVKEKGGVQGVELRRMTRSGAEIDTLFSAEVLQLRDEKVMLSMTQDITRYKRVEEERKRLQDQLFQSQKMESVGRLAGGVAHDFNNMLSVILGRTELALYKVDPKDPLYADLEGIQQAATRSADMTRQLLAFARKQTISPKVLDLNDTVEGLLRMLRRLIGEDIDLAWQPDSTLRPVNMDPSQIDQILANLCVNARDAISGVGRVTIETENVVLNDADCADCSGCVPGDYVMLAVSDNGKGMDDETLANIFEPFYTTKAVGKGTGLGLSTVYGIVKQNQGVIMVESDPGQGTTFKLYLPQHGGEVEGASTPVQEPLPQARGETILLVEDEHSVLDVNREILGNLGYTVLTTSQPAEAARMLRNYAGDVHLLITDVVMPGMDGKALAREIAGICPDIKTLFMSGYTPGTISYKVGILAQCPVMLVK